MMKKILKYKNENELTSRIIVGLLMLVFSVVTLRVINDCFNEYFNFKVEIWGTISDWYMIIVTIITAVFLYKTLESQMEVQKDQAKINKLAVYDLRTKYRGNLTITNPKTNSDYYSNSLLNQIIFKCIENDILEMKIKSNLHFSFSHNHEIQHDGKEYEIKTIGSIWKDTEFQITPDGEAINGFVNELITKSADHKEPVPIFHLNFVFRDNSDFYYSKTFIFCYQPFYNQIDVIDTTIDYL